MNLGALRWLFSKGLRLAWTQKFRWKQAGDLRSSQESEFRLFTWVGLPLERSSQT